MTPSNFRRIEMKANKETGLVPAKVLRSFGSHIKDEVSGFTPLQFKTLKSKGLVAAYDSPEGVETVDIDDDSLLELTPTPSLGGYDHQPPLASNVLPGRNRIDEPNYDHETGRSVAGNGPAYEDDELGRGDPDPLSSNDAKVLKTSDLAGAASRTTQGSTPPAPPASKSK